MPLKPVVVVGSINMDLVCGVERIPATGETILGSNFQMFHGGKGANQAVAVARLGYPVNMVGHVGDDAFGMRLRKGLRVAGVNTGQVSTVRSGSSGIALICADSQYQNSIVVVPGANGKLTPADLDKAAPVLRAAGIILTQLEIPFETVERLAFLACRFSIPLMLDPAPARLLPDHLLRKVDFLTPNETESGAISDLHDGKVSPASAPKVAQRLLRKGVRHVLIKMGDRGVYAASARGTGVMVPPFKVKAVDSTGAGDAFNGGLAVALMRGLDLAAAARFASAVAALSVTRMGAQPSMPTAGEVKKFISSSSNLNVGQLFPRTLTIRMSLPAL
jgi:ribokinase